jgi:hypothetical protein
VFVPRTSRTPVATLFCQTEGRSAERVILGVRPRKFILSEFQSPLRRIFISSHSLPPLWSPNRSFRAARLAVGRGCTGRGWKGERGRGLGNSGFGFERDSNNGIQT